MDIKKLTISLLLLFAVICTAQNTKAWESIDTMDHPVSDGFAAWFNDAIYVFGGYSDSTDAPVDLVQKYDTRRMQWSVVGRLKTPRAKFVADVRDDVVILIGGVTGESATSVQNIEMWYADDTSTQMKRDEFALNRVGAAGAIYNNVFYMFGGDGPNDAVVPFATEYNLALNSINRSWDFNDLHPYEQGLVHDRHHFYLFGGVIRSIRSEIFYYNAFTKELQLLPERLTWPRAASAAVVDQQSNAYVIGGYDESGEPLAVVEKIYLSEDYVELLDFPSLNYTRQNLMAVYVPEEMDDYSSIYVLGGRRASGEMNPFMERIYVYIEQTSSVEMNAPQNYQVLRNYPNPFNAQTTIECELEQSSHVELSIYAANGERVAELENNFLAAGTHKFNWNAEPKAASGVYFCRLVTESGVQTRKLLLMK